MRRCLAALIGALMMPASAADWREELKTLPPGTFAIPRAQTCVYRFGWGAVSAAEATMVICQPAKEQLELKLTTKTIGAARALWQMDATHTALSSSVTLLPIAFEQTEKYRHSSKTLKADFTPKEVVRIEKTEPATKKEKAKRFKFPHVLDMHSALLTVRSQQLQDGDRYSMVVYPDRSGYLAHVDVVGRETIKVAGKSYKAVKLQLALQSITKKGALEAHKRFKSAYAWLSDDKDRLLLKIDSSVYVGSVWMELQSVKFATE